MPTAAISMRLARRLAMLGVALSLGPAATATRAWAEAPPLLELVPVPSAAKAAPAAAPKPIPAEPASPAPKDAAASAGRSEPLERELARFSDWVRRENGELSALVIEVDTGRVLAAESEGSAQNPASNAKLLTAAAALAKLGANFRFSSGVYGAVKDGVATRLVLRSNGDPSLTTKDLERMAKSLYDAGLRRVSGDIFVDQSGFDEKFVPPAFEQQPHEWAAFRAPVSAVAVDRNAFVIRIAAGAAGERAKVSVEPATGFVEISNGLESEGAGKERKIELEMLPQASKLRVRVSGRIGTRANAVSFTRRLEDPRLYPGFVFKKALSKAAVTVDGGVAEGGKDELRALVTRASEPLSVLLRELGKHSDNFSAEMLVKALGAASSGRPGSAGDGAAAIADWMSSAGALDPSTKIVNGSGLFDADRVSAASLCAALAAAYRDPKISPAFVDQLAQGGTDGTLKHRFRANRQRGMIRAKTGTLARAHSLAGYVLAPPGRSPLAFALLVNGIAGKQDEQRRRIDRVVERAATDLWR